MRPRATRSSSRRCSRCSSTTGCSTPNGDWVATGDFETVAVPPTIQALLAARLDRLGAEERAVIERASVEGKVFHRGAVAELSPSRVAAGVGEHLQALVRKELVRPDQAELPGRGRLPLPAPPDPRRGVRRDAEGAARGAARAVRRLARDARASGSSSTRRSSATTSSRPIGTAQSSRRSTKPRVTSPRGSRAPLLGRQARQGSRGHGCSGRSARPRRLAPPERRRPPQRVPPGANGCHHRGRTAEPRKCRRD